VRLPGVSLHNFCTEGEPEPKEPDQLPFGQTKDTKETKDTGVS